MTNSSFLIIPAIDIINGQLVRLTQGDYGQVETYIKTPVEMAKEYEASGATRIHIVDLDGAKTGTIVNKKTIDAIKKETQCEIEFGGGIRSIETVKTLLDMGIDYIILGSLFINDSDLAYTIVDQFPNKIIAGFDTHNFQVATQGWTQTSDTSIFSILKTCQNKPLSSIIFTDIEKDGMMSGPNIEALKKVASETEIPIIASGGIRNTADINALKTLQNEGIIGCIIGKAILSEHLSLSSLWHID